MKELSNDIKLLKAGASNDAYPIYAPYLYSDGKTLRTNNNTTSVCIHKNKPVPFKGYVSIFILEEILNLVGEDMVSEVKEPTEEESGILTIKSGSYKTNITLRQNLNMVEVPEPDFSKSIKLDESTISLWKYALKYVGRESLSPLYVDKEGLCASDGYRVFTSSIPYEIDGKLSLNSKIMNFLKDGYSIMPDKEGNVNVQFLNGFAVFTTEKLDFYPSDRIRDFVATSNHNVSFLCNVAVLRDATEKIAPIFHGESEHAVTIVNSKNKISVTGESITNGTASVEVPSQSDVEFKLMFNAKALKGIPFDFDTYITPDHQDRLFLKNEFGSTIILMGVK